VFRYGVGLGAMFSKQLFRGPGRRALVGSVPAGLRYLRDPDSHKNAGKSSGYPQRLNWIERAGMLLGPAAYLASVATRRSRALHGSGAKRPPMQVERVALRSGRTLSLVSFLDRRAAPAGEEARPATQRRSNRALPSAAALTCLAAPLAIALDLPSSQRMAAVLAFVCIAPGTALVTRLRGVPEPALVLGIGLAATALSALVTVWLGWWEPQALLYALAAASLIGLLPQLVRPGGRLTRPALPPGVALHLLIVTAALVVWGLSLQGAELGRIAGTGLLDAMPASWFLALALLVAGFASAACRPAAAPRLLAVYVVALVVVVHGTTPLLYDEPRYTWTYNHLGMIGLIGETGALDRNADIYNNWPAFFAAGAWLNGVTGLSAAAYAPWAQVIFGLAGVAAVRFALRGITSDERLLWTAAWFFVLANWVGQDYLAPQAFGFVLSLLVLGLCLRWRPAGEAGPAPPLSPRTAAVTGGLLYLAIVATHQLTPLVLLASVIVLALMRRVPLWVPLAMGLVEAGWLALAWPYLSEHYSLVDFNPAASRTPGGYELGDGLPGSELVAYASRLTVVLVVVLAGIGLVRRLRAGHRDLVAVCLAAAPLAIVLLQSYGGEARFRVYLFALPWLCLFAAAAFVPSGRSRPAGFARPLQLALAGAGVGCSLLLSYFGLELMNRVASDDVRAAAWFDRHAPAQSRLVGVTPSFPRRPTAGYARAHDPEYPGAISLTEEGEAFRHRMLGPAHIPPLEPSCAPTGHSARS
jgi:hypothetical protein